jgi:photosystem II stability/assembly factor-like uncharacterized protein
VVKLLTLFMFSSRIRHVSNALFRKNKRFIHLSILIVVILLPVLTGILPGQPVFAQAAAVKWTKLNIPAGGVAGGWVLADGSDVQHLTVAPDGTLYACGQGLPFTLYKSTDGGVKWSYIGGVQDVITGIAVSPHDPATIYYATSSSVYRSTNGGQTFAQMPANPGGAGSGNVEITSIAVTWADNNIIAVGTRDTDSSEYGGVYILDEAAVFAGWTDSGIGAYDAYAVAFSPGYAADRQLTAVATDETDTFIMSKIGNSGWNNLIGRAILNRDNSMPPAPVAVTRSAAIAFPGGYNALAATSDSIFFVGIDTGSGLGDVYKIKVLDSPGVSPATDLNIGIAYSENNIDVTGLAAVVTGSSVTLAAGPANGSQTYISSDSGASWVKSDKPPTGGAATEVLFAPDFGTTGLMYAATSGSGSAFSVSRDKGISWNQTGLIDTTITGIINLAPSPDYDQDSTLFMLTSGSADNLWRNQNDGNTWERIFSSDRMGVDNLSLVTLPPQYGADCRKVLIAGSSNGNTAIWESDDNGQIYQVQTLLDSSGGSLNVNSWAMADKDSLYIGSFDGTSGQIYVTANGGFFFSRVTAVGDSYINDIAFSPDNANDGNILIGSGNGWVYLSGDNGTSFQPIPYDADAPPFTGKAAVAFDPDFKNNHTVYAADDAINGGIYRFTIGRSTEWESIDTTLPAGARISRLSVSGDDILYAVDTQANGSLERCLEPRNASGATFETVADGLSGANLSGLWRCGRRLWTIDIVSGKLMTYNDTLAVPAVQVSPENAATSLGNLVDHAVRNVTLDWDTLEGATSYEWQCQPDADFSSANASLDETASSSYVHLPALEPATTYYWRVRACAPVLSPWSSKRTFTTSLDTIIVALNPESPAAGAIDVPVKPAFAWTAVVGADAYDLLVATDPDFSHPAIVKINGYALATNAWQCDVSLNYDTTYYWKVRANASGTSSAWSAAGVFTTEPAPVITTPTPPTQEALPTSLAAFQSQDALNVSPSINNAPQPTAPLLPPPTSSPATITTQLSSIPAWVIYFVGALLAIVILVLTILLMVIAKIKRIM